MRGKLDHLNEINEPSFVPDLLQAEWQGIDRRPSKISIIKPSISPLRSQAVDKDYSLRVKDAGKGTILVVDDETSSAEAHAILLSELGYRVVIETNSLNAKRVVESTPEISVILLDMRMPNLGGMEVLRQVKMCRPQIGIIIATVINDLDEAVRATRLGAYNYLLKPLQIERLGDVLSSYFNNRPKRILEDPRFDTFVTQSSSCATMFKRILAFAQTDVPVLIQGETGTGKEVAAQLVHSLSPRRNEKFIAVNVAALSPALFEAELFGYKKGSFTGAFRDQGGYLFEAGNGTIFLDEIGELGLEQQKKLLRVIETRRYSRVGDPQEIELHARFVLATNKNLQQDVGRESFRSDLYYRFASHTIQIPSLRSRPEDIELLSGYFLEKYRSQYGRSIVGFSDQAISLLKKYSFPGNVRELDGYISAAVLLEQGAYIEASSLPQHLHYDISQDATDLNGMRWQLILQTLVACNGNQTRAAEKLGMSRSHLNQILRQQRQKDPKTGNG